MDESNKPTSTQTGATADAGQPVGNTDFDPDFLKSVADAGEMSLEDAIAGDGPKKEATPPAPAPKGNPAITPKIARIVGFLMAMDIPPDLREQFVADLEGNELVVFLLNEILDFPGAFAAMGAQGAQNLPPVVRLLGGFAILGGVAFMQKGTYVQAAQLNPGPGGIPTADLQTPGVGADSGGLAAGLSSLFDDSQPTGA